MMRWIIGSSLKLRVVVATLAVLLMVFGFTQLRTMPVDVLPEFSRPHVEIQVEILGLSAQEVEALITTPMEADLLNGTPWVKELRSVSIPGLASISLIFEKGTDLMRARQVAQERLNEVFALPRVAKHFTMINPVSSAGRVMAIGVTSNKLSLIDLTVLAHWTIQPRLLGVPGVANVSIWGRRERQLQVQVDPDKLRDENVTLMQIIKTAGNALWSSPLSFLEASTPGTGGWVETPNQRLGVRHVLPITTAKDLAKVPVEDAETKRLGDVASVVEDHQPLIGDAIVKDGPALMLVVEKLPWANTRAVTQEVEKALAASAIFESAGEAREKKRKRRWSWSRSCSSIQRLWRRPARRRWTWRSARTWSARRCTAARHRRIAGLWQRVNRRPMHPRAPATASGRHHQTNGGQP